MDIGPLESINGLATVLSRADFLAKFPKTQIPRRSQEYGSTFFCRTACNIRTATYSAEFTWGEDALDTEEEVAQFAERIEAKIGSSKQKKTEKRKRKDVFIDDEFDEDEVAEKGTPRKKQKTLNVSTPRKPRTPSKLLTPSHKRYAIKMISTGIS
jgi:origin recognition complex subunit 1